VKIDANLNLVIPIERDGKTAFIHSTPISRYAFESHFRLLATTYADMFGRGGGYANVAPRVATLTLREVGGRLAAEAGDVDEEGRPKGDGGADALLAEIKRQSIVAASFSDGWQMMPVDAALKREVLDEDDWREAEAALVFFTCLCWMTPRKNAAQAVRLMASAIGLSTAALPPSEWMNSLPKSTPEESSAEPQKPSLAQETAVPGARAVSLTITR